MTTTASAPPRLSLDPLQRAAATAPEGPVLLIGGPGTGKTRTLMARILNLLRAGVPPRTISYVVFSSRSADDARRLLDPLTPIQHLFVGTLHQYASHFLRQSGAQTLGITPHYSIWDTEKATQVINEIMQGDPQTLTLTQAALEDFLHWRSYNQAVGPQETRPADSAIWLTIQNLYNEEKRRQGALDLDDLLPTAIRALEQDPQSRHLWATIRSKHLMVDELQDLTPVQFRMLKLMTGATRSITAAADPNQSIYSWRGTPKDLIERFQVEYRGAQVHVLRVNHRSTATLTHVGAALTDHASMTGLYNAHQNPIRPDGPLPTLVTTEGTQYQLDNHFLDRITQMHDEGHPWEEIACIYRRKRTLKRLLTKMTQREIPHTILGDTRNPHNGDAKCITNLMAVLLNPHDATAFALAAATTTGDQRRRLNPDTARQVRRVARDQKMDMVETAETFLQAMTPASQPHTDMKFVVTAYRELSPLLEEPDVDLHDLFRRAHSLLHDVPGTPVHPAPGTPDGPHPGPHPVDAAHRQRDPQAPPVPLPGAADNRTVPGPPGHEQRRPLRPPAGHHLRHHPRRQGTPVEDRLVPRRHRPHHTRDRPGRPRHPHGHPRGGAAHLLRGHNQGRGQPLLHLRQGERAGTRRNPDPVHRCPGGQPEHGAHLALGHGRNGKPRPPGPRPPPGNAAHTGRDLQASRKSHRKGTPETLEPDPTAGPNVASHAANQGRNTLHHGPKTTPRTQGTPALEHKTQTVRVNRVIDGDTVVVTIGGGLLRRSHQERVRLYGIDAPESKQRGGTQSARHLRRMIGSGRGTRMETRDTDQYGRTVALIYPRNPSPENSYNLQMVQAGHAHCYMLSGADQAPYQQAQRDAQEHRRGLWKDRNPTPPWEWRQDQKARHSLWGRTKTIIRLAVILALLAAGSALAYHLYQRFLA